MYDTARRDQVVENTRKENEMVAARVKHAYDIKNVRTALEERMLRDTTKPSDVMRNAAAVESLRTILKEKERQVQERLRKRQDNTKKVSKEEAYRLINFANELNIKIDEHKADHNV